MPRPNSIKGIVKAARDTLPVVAKLSQLSVSDEEFFRFCKGGLPSPKLRDRFLIIEMWAEENKKP